MPLSREGIIEAALRLIERDGWDGLSMRRLAHELDVWPMAVYRYFRDKEELLDAIAETAAERVALPSARGSWRTRMRKLLHETRRTLNGQPPARALLAPSGERLSEAGLRILTEAGFTEEDARNGWLAMFTYSLGFPADQLAEFEFGLECMLDGLEARRPGGVRRTAASTGVRAGA